MIFHFHCHPVILMNAWATYLHNLVLCMLFVCKHTVAIHQVTHAHSSIATLSVNVFMHISYIIISYKAMHVIDVHTSQGPVACRIQCKAKD